MLNDEIKKARIDAMKAKDKALSAVYSVVLNKTMQAAIEKRTASQELTDADVVKVLQKTEKELFDERAGFEKAGRAEKLEDLDKQIEAVRRFLPKMLSEQEIRAVIAALPDKSVPAVMKHFKAEYAGKCDMRTVNDILKSI